MFIFLMIVKVSSDMLQEDFLVLVPSCVNKKLNVKYLILFKIQNNS